MKKALNKKEKFIINIVRYGTKNKIIGLELELSICRFKIEFEFKSSKNLCGRFGGGWNWKLGFQLGGKTLILNFLIFSISFSWIKKKEQ